MKAKAGASYSAWTNALAFIQTPTKPKPSFRLSKSFSCELFNKFKGYNPSKSVHNFEDSGFYSFREKLKLFFKKYDHEWLSFEILKPTSTYTLVA